MPPSIDDIASEQESYHLAIALTKRKPTLQPTGFCQLEGCGEPVEGEARFCGVNCRDEWQRIQNLRDSAGK